MINILKSIVKICVITVSLFILALFAIWVFIKLSVVLIPLFILLLPLLLVASGIWLIFKTIDWAFKDD